MSPALSAVTVRPVRTRPDLRLFIKSQWSFYRNDPNWVPPLVVERMKLLDTSRNPFFQHGEQELFLAEEDGRVVGRIAAITNENHNRTHGDTIGFFGFFECEDRQDVAAQLLHSAEQWLRYKRKSGMRGPVNPSMNDECGLLIDGFAMPPSILMTYNPPYYADLLEGAGLVKVKDLYSYTYGKDDYASEKIVRLQNIVRERHHITVREVDFKNKQQYERDLELIRHFYNTVWEPNWGFVKMTDAEFDALARDLKQIADPAYALFGEIDGTPAGFILALPDLNQVLIHNRSGSLPGFLWHYATKKKRITNQRTVILGVLPEFRRTGIDAVLSYEIGVRGVARGMLSGEAGWVLEDNVEMNNVLSRAINGTRSKAYRLYERHFE